MKKGLLTKEEIARVLSPAEPLSTRSVERYIQLAGVTPAVKGSGRGKQAKFRREDVEKIKTAYGAAAERREQQKESTALATTKPAALQPVAVVAELIGGNLTALSAALDTWPVWLTKAEALERTGLPATWFDAGVRASRQKGEGEEKELPPHGEGLPYHGKGRGRRFHRDDLRAFAERIRDGKYLDNLLGKSTKS